ncbi:MAG TPA: hypothetical protein VLA24_17400 [Pseudomonadales bacterium]|nr:hypothetical protein [Pseudomonadales bacterium]
MHYFRWLVMVVFCVSPLLGQANNFFTHTGKCINCRLEDNQAPQLKMYDLQKSSFTSPKTVAINLPYDVDTAFDMARQAWGLRDMKELVAEGGRRWMYQKAKEGSWIFVEKPGEQYIAKDENTWYSDDGSAYTFYVTVVVKKTSPVTSRLVLNYRGLGEGLQSDKLLNDLMGVAFDVNITINALADRK